MGRYLDNLKPLLNETQFESTRLIVQAFADPDGPGPKVQQELLKRQEQMDNWAYDWWMHDMYMGIKLGLPMNVSPGMVFPYRQLLGFTDIARYAARLVVTAAQFKERLDRGELEVEKAASREKGQPLCMAQYYRLFTSYRLPGVEKDALINTEPNGPKQEQHIILACRNKFYCLELRGNKGRLTEAEIAGHILHVLESGTAESTGSPPVGLLTSQKRDVWAEHRELLASNEVNRDSLDMIEKSMLLVCLDLKPLDTKFNRQGAAKGAKGWMAGNRDETNMEHQMLHGGGSHLNSPNRWFDKTIQLIICNDGVSGLCYEHSPAEGVAVINVIDEMLEACSDLTSDDEDSITPLNTHLRELLWTSPQGLNINKVINEAARSLDNAIEDLDVYVYRFDGFGKNAIKGFKCSPDAFVQLALQLSYYKLYGKLTATYESASTRRFKLGRVDCIRSATWEALQWVSAMAQGENDPLNPSKRVTFSLMSDEEKLKRFDAAMTKQTEVMVDNILGQGVDIHLLGLREQSKIMSMPLDLFEDEAFQLANHFALSTSQVTVKTGFMGYGPVVPDGYGASYNILNDTILFVLSAFHSAQMTSASKFAQSLEESLLSMQTLLQTRSTTT